MTNNKLIHSSAKRGSGRQTPSPAPSFMAKIMNTFQSSERFTDDQRISKGMNMLICGTKVTSIRTNSITP
jgi:hypothetical protein